jgi:hypothetical protein
MKKFGSYRHPESYCKRWSIALQYLVSRSLTASLLSPRSCRLPIAQPSFPSRHLSGLRLAGQPLRGLCRHRLKIDTARESGFILPMAALVTLLLLLGSLSVQGIMLQRQMSDSILLMNHVQEDAIASSAQTVAGALQQKGACLLEKSWQQWNKEACYGALAPSLNGSMAGGSYRVTGYSFTKNVPSPELSTADLALSWQAESSAGTIQKTFLLDLDLSVNPPQLRGVSP